MEKMPQQPNIFTVTYDHLKLQPTPVPFFTGRKLACLCGQVVQSNDFKCSLCHVNYHKACLKTGAHTRHNFMCPSC